MKRQTLWTVTPLLVLAFGLAADLQPSFHSLEAGSQRGNDPLSMLLGDARRIFANHFYMKADVYFHSGYYPSIYDNRESFRTPHIAEDAGTREGRNTGDEEQFLGEHQDWIDAFGRKLFPSVHTHLNEGGPVNSRDGSGVREILPWLKTSASLDPNRVDTYAVTAYWLRTELGKIDEAEAFLREGLRANPGDPTLLFELGRIRQEERRDPVLARNLWEIALANLGDLNSWEGERRFLIGRLLGHLAKLEEEQKRFSEAMRYLRLLEHVSPTPESIGKWIGEVAAKASSPASP